jgi:Fe-S cluster assembly scaffold protein SufB
MLEAAAAALHLVETGDVTAWGTLGPQLRVEPDQPVSDSRPPPEPADLWKRAMDELRAAIDAAQDDPAAAKRLLASFTAASRTPSSFDRIRESLIAAGVPDRFLPDYQEINRVDGRAGVAALPTRDDRVRTSARPGSAR